MNLDDPRQKLTRWQRGGLIATGVLSACFLIYVSGEVFPATLSAAFFKDLSKWLVGWCVSAICFWYGARGR